MKVLEIAVVAVTLTKGCASPEIMKQRQDVVNLCEARGGIPILNDLGDNMVNCAFPPGAPLSVERVKQ